MQYEYPLKCSLLVSTSDNYQCAWYPYFELIKIYWKNHPKSIFLNCETKGYIDESLNIQIIYGGREKTWSERLYNCLKQIRTDYIIFSLEDFFLTGQVDDDAIEQCVKWMDENKEIAECRLKSSNLKCLQIKDAYGRFRIANSDTPYRLDTQVAIWRKKDLLGFLNKKEDPWHFETDGTQRIKDSKKIFLWLYADDEEDETKMIFPYHINQRCGYGIAWGRWLWNNKKLFEKNKIMNVDYKSIGVLSEKAVKRRFKYLYRAGRRPVGGIEKYIQKVYRIIDRIEKGMILIRLYGGKEGVKRIRDRI